MKSVIVNYIPHKTPKNINFDKWFNFYKKDLINLYTIFQTSINNKYKYNKLNWESNILFTKFTYLIFSSSSKYIPLY